MEDIERVKTRLANIRTVAPILGALRTISLGSWQMALNQRKSVKRYSERLLTLLPTVVAQLPPPRPTLSQWIKRRGNHAQSQTGGANDGGAPKVKHLAILVIGSERGLCGRFNDSIFEHTQRYLAEQINATDSSSPGIETTLMVLGTRLVRTFKRHEYPLYWTGKLSATALPSFELAFGLAQTWLARYEARELDAVDILYNGYQGAARYEPTMARLIPPQAPSSGPLPEEEAQMPTIVETDPLRLYTRLVGQWTAIRCYELLLESAAS